MPPNLPKDVTLRHQTELGIFSKDPTEAFSSLQVIATEADWDRLGATLSDADPFFGFANGAAIGDVAMMPSGGGAAALSPLTFGPMSRQDYWADIPIVGDGGQPAGDGSVKALRVWQHGLCSHETPIQDILEQVVDGLQSQFIDGACANPGLQPDFQFARATTYLAHATGFPQDVHGGFQLASHLRVHDDGYCATTAT